MLVVVDVDIVGTASIRLIMTASVVNCGVVSSGGGSPVASVIVDDNDVLVDNVDVVVVAVVVVSSSADQYSDALSRSVVAIDVNSPAKSGSGSI